MPSRVTCNLCGAERYAGPGVLPAGKYRCRQCRRLEPQAYGTRRIITAVCPTCGETFECRGSRPQTYCSLACWNTSTERRARRIGIARARPTEWTARTSKAYRDSVTPGLTAHARAALLTTWQAQGRTCSYCLEPPTSVDHVVPVARGGTNYEGNLAPACRACNSSKCDLLLSEWKHNRPHAGTITQRSWMDEAWRPRPTPQPPTLELMLAAACVVCGHTFTPRSSAHLCCSRVCQVEWAARHARNAYRRRVGLPEDWTTPRKVRA